MRCHVLGKLEHGIFYFPYVLVLCLSDKSLWFVQGLTAVDVTDDSSMIAGGFADSTVRVWSLTPKKLRSVKSTTGKFLFIYFFFSLYRAAFLKLFNMKEPLE